jgi:hypothetical protein
MMPAAFTLRTRSLPPSLMYRFPAESVATQVGTLSPALGPGPPSPEKEREPLPATVVMMPLTDTLRTLELPPSAIYKLPALSNAMPKGVLSAALVAGPPSPEKDELPFPVMVEIVPFADTLRILLAPSPPSEM